MKFLRISLLFASLLLGSGRHAAVSAESNDTIGAVGKLLNMLSDSNANIATATYSALKAAAHLVKDQLGSGKDFRGSASNIVDSISTNDARSGDLYTNLQEKLQFLRKMAAWKKAEHELDLRKMNLHLKGIDNALSILNGLARKKNLENGSRMPQAGEAPNAPASRLPPMFGGSRSGNGEDVPVPPGFDSTFGGLRSPLPPIPASFAPNSARKFLQPSSPQPYASQRQPSARSVPRLRRPASAAAAPIDDFPNLSEDGPQRRRPTPRSNRRSDSSPSVVPSEFSTSADATGGESAYPTPSFPAPYERLPAAPRQSTRDQPKKQQRIPQPREENEEEAASKPSNLEELAKYLTQHIKNITTAAEPQEAAAPSTKKNRKPAAAPKPTATATPKDSESEEAEVPTPKKTPKTTEPVAAKETAKEPVEEKYPLNKFCGLHPSEKSLLATKRIIKLPKAIPVSVVKRVRKQRCVLSCTQNTRQEEKAQSDDTAAAATTPKNGRIKNFLASTAAAAATAVPKAANKNTATPPKRDAADSASASLKHSSFIKRTIPISVKAGIDVGTPRDTREESDKEAAAV